MFCNILSKGVHFVTSNVRLYRVKTDSFSIFYDLSALNFMSLFRGEGLAHGRQLNRSRTLEEKRYYNFSSHRHLQNHFTDVDKVFNLRMISVEYCKVNLVYMFEND